ncbi:WbqC family protein [Nitrospinae bacterium AH_259_B05_G02_I21]|nr:WbqC family protein [Nitrospinae bacterium AH_259_B05_G02_I21]MDA2931657.1 WbqC family protein [Nitrospinae bacterium AH-259-F20]
MIVTIHQPEYLPWLGFFDKACQSEIFVLLDNVQFRKNYFQNRNRIKTPQGEKLLTVPVRRGRGSSKTILEVEIDNSKDWRRKHWTTIANHYRSAPYFPDYEADFQTIYERSWYMLLDLNIVLILLLAKHLGVATRFIRSSELGISGKGSELNLRLCKAVGATTYLSGRWGRVYIDEPAFKRADIKIVYQEFQHPIYPQLFEGFLPALGGIDLLFNCGPESRRILDKARVAPAQASEKAPNFWENQ